jgi:hypothetical protein
MLDKEYFPNLLATDHWKYQLEETCLRLRNRNSLFRKVATGGVTTLLISDHFGVIIVHPLWSSHYVEMLLEAERKRYPGIVIKPRSIVDLQVSSEL